MQHTGGVRVGLVSGVGGRCVVAARPRYVAACWLIGAACLGRADCVLHCSRTQCALSMYCGQDLRDRRVLLVGRLACAIFLVGVRWLRVGC